MYEKVIALLLSLAMVLSLCSLTACGKRGSEGDTNKDGDTADAKYTLTIGHVYTEDSIEHKQMAKIKELVEEKTNGACQVKIFANEQLGDEQNIAEQCVTGACDMGFSEGSVWATVTNKPEFAVFGLPFQYSNIDAAKEVTANLIRPELNKIADGTGLYVLGNVYSGFRHMLSVKSPIKTLDDLKGMKIRVPNATIYVDMFKDMGANPTTTAFSETYQALQQGVVDGCECDLANIVQQNWMEVNNYMSYTYHLAAMNVICIFSYIFALEGMGQKIVDFMLSITTSPTGLFFLVIAFMVVIGCFMESLAALPIILPIIYPMFASLGVNLNQLGVVFALSTVLGGLTPPVGIYLFLSMNLTGAKMKETVLPHMLIVIGIMLLVIVLCILLPIPQFLPDLVFGAAT